MQVVELRAPAVKDREKAEEEKDKKVENKVEACIAYDVQWFKSFAYIVGTTVLVTALVVSVRAPPFSFLIHTHILYRYKRSTGSVE